MNKGFIGIALAMSMIAMTGCDIDERYEDGEMIEQGAYKVVGEKGYEDILRDVDTGCLYRLNTQSRVKTPYYGEDGEVQGCGEKDISKSKYE